MLEGWLIYHRDDYEKNCWFADALTRQAGLFGLDIRLQIIGEADLAGYAPAFAVNRSRDWRIAEGLEQKGCRVFNPSAVSRVGNDKIASHALAARLGLPQVETAACGNRVECLAHQPLGYPVVVKNPYGHGGNEVFLVQDECELLTAAAGMKCASVLLEQLCGRPGCDIRVYVLGGRILTAVKRCSDTDFRANLSLGGAVAHYGLNDAERELVGRVIQTLPLDWAGVDFILDETGGLLFNELEDAVGARSLYALGGYDVIELLLGHIRNMMLK